MNDLNGHLIKNLIKNKIQLKYFYFKYLNNF